MKGNRSNHPLKWARDEDLKELSARFSSFVDNDWGTLGKKVDFQIERINFQNVKINFILAFLGIVLVLTAIVLVRG